MREETEKAFQDWWATAAVTSSPRETFLAGWDAAASGAPALDRARTREEEFEKWWAHANENSSCEKRAAKWVWECAWCSAKLGQLERAKAEVLSEVKAKLFADATSAFLDGDDKEAQLLRRIANDLGK